MLDSLKKKFVQKQAQYLVTDSEATVIESDNEIITLTAGTYLGDIHPFFHSLTAIDREEGSETAFSCVHLELDGRDLIADILVNPIPQGFFIVLMDFTAHYNNYQMMTQARNESVIAQELMVIKNRELEEREKFKNRFIRNFSHELRNPLTSIIAMTNVLGGTALKPDQKKMIDFIMESNTNLQLMLEDMLSLNMIAAGKLELRESLFDFTRLMELLQFTYSTRAKSQGIDFSCKTDPDIPTELEGDRLRLFQVLTNLLDNAIRYTREGMVVLRATLNQKWANKANLRFEVEDTGPGIPEEKQAQIFESFVQLHPGKGQGSGLGLAIVKNLLELMGSEIKVDSAEGKGSRFYFDISLKYPLGLKTEIRHIPQSTDKQITASDRKYRLLLVEDDIRVQTAVFKSLTDTGMFYIDLVSDGGMVIQELMNSDYDLVLMDVDLPTTSGDQLTRIIRELPFPNVHSIPVIGLTANAFKDTLSRCKESGMQAVVTKPFEEAHLLTVIKANLS